VGEKYSRCSTKVEQVNDNRNRESRERPKEGWVNKTHSRNVRFCDTNVWPLGRNDPKDRARGTKYLCAACSFFPNLAKESKSSGRNAETLRSLAFRAGRITNP